MHFWQKSTNCPHIYHINKKPLANQKAQHKDLGIILTNDLNWSPHYNSIINQFYKILGLVRRTFRPYLIKDITALERVQRRVTLMTII